MDDIDKERQMVRAAAAKTAEKVVAPRAAEIDEKGQLPKEMVETFGKQGFLSLLLPEEYGGVNGDTTSFCSVVEEIAKVCASSALLILNQGVGTLPIWLEGSPSQKELCFTQISEKNCLTALALAESESGSDPSSLKTSAKREGKDYVLNGRKCFVTNGSIAHFYSVFAVTDPERGREGISGFLMEGGTPGLLFGKKEEKIGMRGSVTTDVILENCHIAGENRLGEEGGGWKIAADTLNRSRPAMGALSVGTAQGALDYAVRYANERIQFGKPISSFQAIQFMIADMATLIEAARAMVYLAAAHVDDRLEDMENLSLMAKIYASDVAMKVTTDAVQILGGYGYMRDYPVERMMRDAKVVQVYEGTTPFHHLALARQLWRR
jgi:alkylation response protein AidB-like acyl-CoA dehydrogenase